MAQERALGVVRAVNAAARQRGALDAVLQFDNLATQSQYRTAYALTSKYVRRGDTVLDWGCGNGHFSLFLETLGACVTGFSFEPAPRVMNDSPRFMFVAGSPDEPRRLPFAGAQFDMVVSVGVIEHVWETGGDERDSLAELYRVLKPGGHFLTFHLPNRTGWIESAVALVGLKKHLHGRRYSGAEIRALWTGAGFEIVEIGRYNALPRNELRALPSALRHAGWFARACNAADDALGALAPMICTNYFVVARKAS